MNSTIKNIKTLLLTAFVSLLLSACGGSDSTEASNEPPPSESTCTPPVTQTLENAVATYGNVINSLSTQNTEFSSRSGSFDSIYNIGQFLQNGAFERQIQIGGYELEPVEIEGTQINGGYSSNSISTAENSQHLDGSDLGSLVGFSLALDYAAAKSSEREMYVEFNVAFEDLTLRQLNNTQEIIDRNIQHAPNANQFVYGIYEARITNRLKIRNHCNDIADLNSSTDLEFFTAQLENASVDISDSSNEIIIKSDIKVPVGYLVRDISPRVLVPYNINAIVTEGPNIKLTWASLSPQYHYRVYFSKNSNFEITDENVERADVNNPEFSLQQQLKNGQSWYFRVSSLVGGNESDPSSRISVTIPVLPPDSSIALEANARPDGSIRLQWGSPDANDAIEYTIFRKKQGDSGFIELATIKPNTTPNPFLSREFIDSNLEFGTTYTYQISYSNFLSPPSSLKSDQVIVTTVAVPIEDNPPPVADAGQNIDAKYGDTVVLDGGGSSDDKGELVSFFWQQSPENDVQVSIFNQNQPQATFVAPTSAESQLVLTFTLTVSDGVSEDSDTVVVTLTSPSTGGGNTPPQAVINASTLTPLAGEVVNLSATDSTDQDNEQLSYKWNQIDDGIDLGIDNLTDAAIAFTVPSGIAPDTKFIVLLEVSDGLAKDTAIAEITVAEIAQQTGPLALQIESSSNPVLANEQIMLMLHVSNPTAVDKTNVVLTLDYPAAFKSLDDDYISDGGDCPENYSSCYEGDTVIWQLGALKAHSSTFVSLPPTLLSDLSAFSVISLSASVTDSSNQPTVSTYALRTATERPLNLTVSETQSPVTVADKLEYTFNYGFSATSVVAEDTVLEVDIPQGTSFHSADGGVLANGKVKWTLGRIDPGETGQSKLVLNIDDTVTAGSQIKITGELSANTIDKVTASTVTGIVSTADVTLTTRVYPQPIRPGEQAYIALTAANNSSNDISNLDLYLRYSPLFKDLSSSYISDGGHCKYNDCRYGNEFLSWSLGTLKAHSATTVNLTPVMEDGIAPGMVAKLYAELEQNNSIQVLAKSNANIAVIENRQLQLTVNAEHNPIMPGETFTYNIQYGFNASSTVASGVALSLELDDSTTFLSATSQGQHSAGVVSWNLNRLDPGEFGEVQVTVKLNQSAKNGSSVSAQAIIKDDSLIAPQTTYTTSIVPVEQSRPLELAMIAGPSPIVAGEQAKIKLLINNNSDFKRSNISVNLRYPSALDEMSYEYYVSNGGKCSSYSSCRYAGEFLNWNIGDIAANSTKIVSLTPAVRSNITSGTLVALFAELEEGNNYTTEAVATIPVRNDDKLDFVIVEDKNPVLPGELLTYSLNYGRYAGADNLTGTMLVAELPDNVEHIASSNNGVITGKTVSWALGDLLAGESASQTVTVRVKNTVSAGSTVTLTGALSQSSADQTNLVSHKSIAGIEAQRPLELAIVPNKLSFKPGETVELLLTVNNTSDFVRSDIVLKMRFPKWLNTLSTSAISDGGSCSGSYCSYYGEFITWQIASLAANGSKSVSLKPVVAANAVAGALLQWDASVTDSSDTETRENKIITIEE